MTDLILDGSSLYLVGRGCDAGDSRWRIEKRSAVDGSPNTGFGQGGVVSTDPSPGAERPLAIAVGSTAVYTAGWVYPLNGPNHHIEKRLK